MGVAMADLVDFDLWKTVTATDDGSSECGVQFGLSKGALPGRSSAISNQATGLASSR